MPTKARTVFFVMVGVAGLVLKGHYSGAYLDAVRSYGGNVAVSFAVYFTMLHLPHGSKYGRLLAAAATLAAVESFEAADGFGLMANRVIPGGSRRPGPG